jgi:glycosyltransferase involved in cell wall biosynthesis
VHIAIVGPTHPYKGGVAQHTTELAHRLRRAGHEVRLESWSAQYPKVVYPGQQTIEAPEYELFPDTRRALSWRRPDSWWRLGRRLRDAADVLVLAVASPVQVLPYVGILSGLRGGGTRGGGTRGGGTRVIALCHNVIPHEQRRLDQNLMRALLRRVDTVFVHSAQQAAVARELAAVPVSVAALAPHLPLTGAGGVRRGPDTALRRRLLFFGIVRPYKGLDVLLRALALGPADVSLTVAGEFWGGTAATERLIAKLGLADRVTLRPGYVRGTDVGALFEAADALVLPYRSATASQNVWMAFEHGIPVISTRAGALADPVTDGVDGLVCAPDDVAALADALTRFYQPGTAQRLRAAVGPVDPEPYWKRYLDALLTAGVPA